MVAAAWKGSRLVGVLPLLCSKERIHGLPLRTVDLASNVVSYHPEIVASESADQLLADALARAHQGRWDLFRATSVPDDSATQVLLSSKLRALGLSPFTAPGECSPYIKVAGQWDAFLRTRSKKFRANMLRTARRSDDFGAVSTRWFLEGGEETTLLSEILEIESRSWKAGAGSAITSRPIERQYHERLLPVLSELRALFANVLYADGKPAAYVLCCRYGNWVGQLKTSYDLSFKDAGARVIDDSVQRAFLAGAGVYDFLGDATPHKTKWTDLVRSHQSYWVYSSRPLARALSMAKRASSLVRRTPASILRDGRNMSGPDEGEGT
jgi:CelD/BcsL family acetyltransferase involved in cellulose biosynthesis